MPVLGNHDKEIRPRGKQPPPDPVYNVNYFAERAEVNGFPYFNTALKGDGDRYRDPQWAFLASEHSYLLLTLHRGAPHMVAELKNLKGAVLDRREIAARAPSQR